MKRLNVRLTEEEQDIVRQIARLYRTLSRTNIKQRDERQRLMAAIRVLRDRFVALTEECR